MKSYAPIALFVYNRPYHTKATLRALSKNKYAQTSTLYIFADGIKKNATKYDIEKVRQTRSIIKQEKWCPTVNIIENSTNKGLANSIISGVTEIIKKHGRVIVLEDDIITSKSFLKFMNEALDLYEHDEQVMHISGYMYPNHNIMLPSSFFYPLPYPWGWATWERAWNHFIDDADYLFNAINDKELWSTFNSDGGSFFKKQLSDNMNGSLRTWFVKWHACNVLNNGLTLFPHKSLTYNIGFDGSGENCGTTKKYSGPIARNILLRKQPITVNEVARKIIIRFYKNVEKPSVFKIIKRKVHKVFKLIFMV